VNLSDYMGKWVVFFFWPLDFAFVCFTEIKEFSRRIKAFESRMPLCCVGSVDSKYATFLLMSSAWAGALPKSYRFLRLCRR
jgi:alkyl hydroperoxide reductase subunit AhpC